MTQWKIIINPDAINDIEGIYDYISEKLKAPESARKQIRRIVEAVESLDCFPFRYQCYEREPWKTRGLRSMPIDNFIIFYVVKVSRCEIDVVHVFYGGQNIEEML